MVEYHGCGPVTRMLLWSDSPAAERQTLSRRIKRDGCRKDKLLPTTTEEETKTAPDTKNAQTEDVTHLPRCRIERKAPGICEWQTGITGDTR